MSMNNARKTFLNWLYNIVTTDIQPVLGTGFPTINFICENWETKNYPCISAFFIKENWRQAPVKELYVQLDIEFNSNQTDDCNKVLDLLMSNLLFNDSYSDNKRKIVILNYDLTTPIETSGVVVYGLYSDVQDLSFLEMPEIRRKSFTMKLTIID